MKDLGVSAYRLSIAWPRIYITHHISRTRSVTFLMSFPVMAGIRTTSR
jgi:hypothetical protein